MSVARVRALRGLQSALRSSNARAVPRVSAPARTQLAVGRRWASGESHGHAEPSSDMPWLIGAVVVTIPACWYLWPSAAGHAEHEAHTDNTHLYEGGGHGSNASYQPDDEKQGGDSEPKEEGEESQEQGEQKDDAEAKDTEEKGSTQAEAGDSGSEKPAEGKQSSDDQAQSKSSPAAQQSKGGVAEDSDANTETRKVEDDSKGGKKKRVDSGLQKNLGESEETHDDDGKDKAKNAKPTSDDLGDISKKQQGFSNTPTRHSLKIDEDPEKSKKSEGGPDTAKVMGTVDPNRPAT